MTIRNLNTIDVIYDDKAYGQIIDPNQWNDNFKKIEENINNNVVSLLSDEGSQLLGSAILTGLGDDTALTVFAQLSKVVEHILNRYTKSESDALLAGGTNNLVKEVDVNLTTGVITVTKKDNTTVSFDTALEKVPATFEIIESAGKFYLKITNVDGTTSQTDLTNLMDVYNYNNTATVSFVKSGTGNVKTITAEVRDASIGLEKLSITAISQIESWANTASNGATTATTQAGIATTKAGEAATSAATAVTKATEASVSAQTAATKAGDANSSAANALSSANSAAASASTATTKASEAAASATAANTSQNQAATSATNAATSEANALVSKNAAATSATDANTKATEAATSATNANNSANAAAASAASAAGSASAATTKANEAATSASNASTSANNSSTSATSANNSKIEAQSWAIGGTGSRVGEDTDNSKFYYEKTIITYNDFVNRYNMNFLTQGNLMAGYYGKVNGLITGTNLCTAVGLTAGTLAVSGDITWLKFSHNYKTLFVADRAIRTTISWDQIQAQNLVKGKVITIGDKEYLCRLMTGGNSNPASAAGGEWNDLIVAFAPNDGDSHWNGFFTFTQEILSTDIAKRVYLGGVSATYFGSTASTSSSATITYRPVLELL